MKPSGNLSNLAAAQNEMHKSVADLTQFVGSRHRRVKKLSRAQSSLINRCDRYRGASISAESLWRTRWTALQMGYVLLSARSLIEEGSRRTDDKIHQAALR